jgi:high-affinity iron transporter
MQVIGWLPITPIQGVFIPYWMGQWFGLFATWQGILLQIVALIVVIGSYFLAEYQTKQHRQPTRQSVAS